MEKPKYIHDCAGCSFLGTFLGDYGGRTEFDLYYCSGCESSLGGSIIARYGNDGPEYLSTPLTVLRQATFPGDQATNPLLECARRAKARGMLGPNSIRLILSQD